VTRLSTWHTTLLHICCTVGIRTNFHHLTDHVHLGGDIFGRAPGPLGVSAEQMTDEAWEYVFCNGPWPDPEPFPKDKADALKHEFNYFYPFDMRSSGKDLVQNNLTFLLYNHAAIFPEDKWPKGIRTNGHLMLNGKKMSKSTGNSLTLREGVLKFGADAMRLSLADAGDGVEDANFDEKTANANILRLHTLMTWCEVYGFCYLRDDVLTSSLGHV
jgi:leucyl-tRNA synthetase